MHLTTEITEITESTQRGQPSTETNVYSDSTLSDPLDNQKIESPFQVVVVHHFDILCLLPSVISVFSVVQ